VSQYRDIRLVLSDVDGTLVTKDKVLTPASIAVVRELRAAGVAFAITSSRPPRGLRMYIEPLDLKVPIAGVNGGLYVNPDRSVIESHVLDLATAQATVRLMSEQGLGVWVYTQDDWLVRDEAGPHVAREAWILQFDAKVVTTFTDADLSKAVKIVGVSDDHALVATCETLAAKSLGAKASVARSETHFLDVTNPQANKGAVVGVLSKLLDIPADQIATLGDMPNDVSMFRKSGLSIAMGNASDQVKAQASEVTDTNENDGFAKAVRKFILGTAAA
jgi:Cof subfamily protein (haloacid dehalogenase superfamily)